MLATMKYHSDDMEGVLSLVEDCKNRFPDQARIVTEIWRANALGKLGHRDEAIQIYQNLIDSTSDEEMKQTLQRKMDALTWQKKGQLKIYGFLKDSKGKPLGGIPVYLFKKGEGDLTKPEVHLPRAVTDDYGRFTFDNLPDGYYNYGIELCQDKFKGAFSIYGDQNNAGFAGDRFIKMVFLYFKSHVQLILPGPGETFGIESKGKVRLSWKEVRGAAYYVVSLGPSSEEILKKDGKVVTIYCSSNTSDIISTNHELTIDFNDNDSIPMLTPDKFTKTTYPPQYIVGWIYPGSRISWRVVAYNEEGEILADSFDLGNPFNEEESCFVFDYGELKTGDQQVLDVKYMDAYKIYLKEFKKNPDNKETYQKLIKLVDLMCYQKIFELKDFIEDIKDLDQMPKAVLRFIKEKNEKEKNN